MHRGGREAEHSGQLGVGDMQSHQYSPGGIYLGGAAEWRREHCWGSLWPVKTPGYQATKSCLSTPRPFLRPRKNNLEIYFILFWFLKRCYVLIFREKGREGENINVRGRHWSVTSCTPSTRGRLATQACALTGNWTGDALLRKMVPTHWTTPVRTNLEI